MSASIKKNPFVFWQIKKKILRLESNHGRSERFSHFLPLKNWQKKGLKNFANSKFVYLRLFSFLLAWILFVVSRKQFFCSLLWIAVVQLLQFYSLLHDSQKMFEKNQPSCRISSGRFVFKTVYYFISAFNLLHFSQSKAAGLQMWLCSFLRRQTQSNFSNLLRVIRKTTYFTKFLLQWIQCISKNWRRIDLINVLAFSINFMLGVFGVP